jgi:hypothetical protein
MTEQLQKIAESRGGVRRTGSIEARRLGLRTWSRSAQSRERVTSVPCGVASRSQSPRSWARGLRPTRLCGIGSLGGLTRCFAWFTGRPMGPSPKVMNSVYIYIIIIYIVY